MANDFGNLDVKIESTDPADNELLADLFNALENCVLAAYSEPVITEQDVNQALKQYTANGFDTFSKSPERAMEILKMTPEKRRLNFEQVQELGDGSIDVANMNNFFFNPYCKVDDEMSDFSIDDLYGSDNKRISGGVEIIREREVPQEGSVTIDSQMTFSKPAEPTVVRSTVAPGRFVETQERPDGLISTSNASGGPVELPKTSMVTTSIVRVPSTGNKPVGLSQPIQPMSPDKQT